MTQTTHWDDCWKSGPEHYECAVGEIERLQLAYDDQHAVASLMHQQAENAEAEIERLNAEAETLFHNYSHMVKQRNKLDDEVERLRAALHKIAYLQHEIDSPPLISEAEAMRIAAREALHASRGES